MCGIVSIFNIKQQTPMLRQKALQMSGRIRHRGPDWSGIYCGGYAAKYQFMTGSDCEVILALYRDKGDKFLNELDGIFAFALYDVEQDEYLIARDPIGVIPLYYGYDKEGRLYVASELKALEGQCDEYKVFPPGHLLTSRDKEPRRYYQKDWFSYDNVKDNPANKDELREALEGAVRRQMMSDVPYGVLLSGGLDSSIISAVAQKYAENRIETGGKEAAWWPRLHSFAVGLQGAPDLEKARLVANHIGTVHHEINYTIQEGLDALSDVVYFTETYDVTTIRASTPMYLLARVIKSMGIKMVLSGEGADEVFGGYLYFHKAPDARAFHEETVRKLSKLHLYDCLRANKSLAAWGVEGRVPFLDTAFLDVAMRLNPLAKMCPDSTIEKKILREAFSYRTLFAAHFPSDSAAATVPSVPSVACSTAEALAWDKAFAGMNDPSGRAISGVHNQAY